MQSSILSIYDLTTGYAAAKGTCSSRSRSTSPGSSLILGADEEIHYQSYSVRNTFVEFTEERPRHTDGHLHERDILSCPASRIGMMRLWLPEDLEGLDTAAEAASAAMALPPRSASKSIQQFAAGSSEMPTVGSSEHATGNCKPCAFFFKQCCENGLQCKFCHLCEPGEKKRRQQQKKTQIRQRAHEHQAEQLAVNMYPKPSVTVARCGGPLPPVVVNSQTSPTIFSSLLCGERLAHVPYDVKNTFVETSLDASMLPPERAIFSCPASKIGCMRLPKPPALDLLDSDDLDCVPLATPQQWPMTPLDCWPVESAFSALAEPFVYLDSPGLTSIMFSIPAIAPPMEDAPWLWQPMMPAPPPAAAATLSVDAPLLDCPHTIKACESVENALATTSASVLRLADTIPEPELGTEEVPTVGSINHDLGTCRPCAFLYKQGCGNGVNCPFCHLCDAGEKKRRQKVKKAQLQSMKQELGTVLP